MPIDVIFKVIFWCLLTGMWYNILLFLNICGVVSNAFLVAFTSAWGAKYDMVGKLWIVIIFEVRSADKSFAMVIVAVILNE